MSACGLPAVQAATGEVYVTDLKTSTSSVTQSGMERNYTIGDRNHTKGWLQWAKAPQLLGKSLTDPLPNLASTSGMCNATVSCPV